MMKDEIVTSLSHIKAWYVFLASLKTSRKRGRQLGNHSLFTEGLEGRDDKEEGVREEEGGG